MSELTLRHTLVHWTKELTACQQGAIGLLVLASLLNAATTTRQHPMLFGYEQLKLEQKIERDTAWELLGQVPKELGTHRTF